MTHMGRELREAPEAVARFLARNGASLAALGARLRAQEPHFIITSARGSSDHAAGFFKYLSEILSGVPVSSVGASVVSVYGAKLKAKGALALTISQSGQSPDILALQAEAKAAGALTVALVNVEESPAAREADVYLPLCAGPELSVAATKSFIVSAAAGAAIAAHWRNDAALLAAVNGLPAVLRQAAEIAWPAFVDAAAGRPKGAPRLPKEIAPRIPAAGAIPGGPEPLPDTMTYDAVSRRLHVGKGFIENVTPEMWAYEVSGKQVVRQWFSYRRRDRSKPIIGDRRPPSPLEKIQPEGWLAEYTTDLLNLLRVLGRLIALEPAQEKLLDAICAGSLIGPEALAAAGLAPEIEAGADGETES